MSTNYTFKTNVNDENNEPVELTYEFSPSQALSFAKSLIDDEDLFASNSETSRKALIASFIKSNFACGADKSGVISTKNFTERELLIASAFFELGSHCGLYIYDHTQANNYIGKQNEILSKQQNFIFTLYDEYKKDRKKLTDRGKFSPWKIHEGVILKHIEKYKNREHTTQKDACLAIQEEIHLQVPQNTFSTWWKKYKDTGVIFDID